MDVPIQGWDDDSKHQLHHEAMKYIDYQGDEVEGLCYETEQFSV